ncbi:hypothetical protein PHLCEN_2v2969 [Hermanssonia centrifuga]|uniref:Peptidase A1 domain-containing protein n=1 Tax=Hermanssonia centrifuga TaxID=98765 RepID=A0A2R6REQ2_9APHY|nr:hypothetical protein PHLCEN_2v2969 [Hermanssonia centrifuga]
MFQYPVDVDYAQSVEEYPVSEAAYYYPPEVDASGMSDRRLHRLARPDVYRHQRPSFYSVYARAARRYGFESGAYAGFAMRNNVVVKVAGLYDKSTDHEVPTEGVQNEYVVPVTIGNPGVTLNLDFDTGSSDLWVWSSELAGVSQYTDTHTIYDPRMSETAQRVYGTWNISYGDGSSASGDVYTDMVTVAGVTMPSQAVECSRSLSSAFLQDGGNDGLLGLAWPILNTVTPQPVKTPMENMMEQGLIEHPLFTVKLTRGHNPGFYSFGYIDYNVTPHAITYTPVDNSQGFWQVSSRSFAIGSQTFDRRGNTAILDTGTSLCLVDDDTVRAIYGEFPCRSKLEPHSTSIPLADSIEGATYDDQHGGWKYPSDVSVPNVAFAVGDKYYTIHPDDFGFGSAGDGYILGGIQSRGDMNYDIFGDVFLKSPRNRNL